MLRRPDARAYADWIRTLTRERRRNGLDDVADELEAVRADLRRLSDDRETLLARAAHEAWMKAKAGGTPDEIARAVRSLGEG